MARYQAGTIEKEKTKLGMCYYIRFRKDGARPRYRLGLVKDLPSKAALERSASEVRKTFNEGKMVAITRTFGDLIERYKREGMPSRFSTSNTYKGMLRRHIEPKWSSFSITEVKSSLVEAWLKTLISKRGTPLSTRSIGHVRDLMRVLFRLAMHWEMLDAAVNPMTLFQVKGSTRRRHKPKSLTPEEFTLFMSRLAHEPTRVMVIVAALSGLRMSEIGGLRWNDFDWIGGFILATRGIVHGHVDDLKTEASLKQLPLHPVLARTLLIWRERSAFREHDDYVFASPFQAGEKPYTMNNLQQRYLRPIARTLGWGNGIGFHTFRHSYRSWLREGGAKPEEQRDLMRHADIATTLNVYGDTFPEPLREANAQVVKLVMQ